MLAGNSPSFERLCASNRSSDKTDILMLTAREGGHSRKHEQQKCKQLLRSSQNVYKEN